jgi:hypothetical protein
LTAFLRPVLPAAVSVQVLFYTRMLADIVGRMLPRRKMWAITAPAALLVLAGGLLIASVAFFVYLQVGGAAGLELKGC